MVVFVCLVMCVGYVFISEIDYFVGVLFCVVELCSPFFCLLMMWCNGIFVI